VDQPQGMSGSQPLGHLAGEIDGSPSGERTALLQQIGDGPTLNVLHDDPVARLVSGLHEIEDLDDIRVAQPGRDPRLAAESLAAIASPFAIQAHSLRRHRAPQPVVPGEEDLPHAAHSQAADEAVGPNAVLRRLGHWSFRFYAAGRALADLRDHPNANARALREGAPSSLRNSAKKSSLQEI